MPTFAPAEETTATTTLRYEDATQDGRLQPIALPSHLGALWRDVLVSHAGARNTLAKGIIPILTRMTMITTESAIRVDRAAQTHAGFQLTHAREGDVVSKLFMNVWADVRGAAGKLSRHVAPGELVSAGTIFAEHTFTRLMAPPGQRAVTRLDVDGYPGEPDVRYDAPAPTTAQELPAGAQWLGELARDAIDTTFTLDHTDQNQHVNSLVYVRLFLDATYRRLAAEARHSRSRSRAIDIAYRKPCFAGDRVHVQLRMFELPDQPGQLGAAGAVFGDDGKPRCYVRVLIAP